MFGKKHIIYNGVRMIEGWPAKIEEAQTMKTYVIAAQEYQRLRYGEEEDDWGANRQPCHDCGVLKG